MIVLDASAVIELVLRTPRGARVGARVTPPGESLHVPHLLDLEVAQVLRRYEARRVLTTAETEQALVDLLDLDLVRHEHALLVGRIWQLRANLTAYDACYVALAEALGAPLATCDARLAAAPGLGVTVELFA